MLSKISLIKEVRNEAGCSLYEAKEIVEKLYKDIDEAKTSPLNRLDTISRLAYDNERNPDPITRLAAIKRQILDFEIRTDQTL